MKRETARLWGALSGLVIGYVLLTPKNREKLKKATE